MSLPGKATIGAVIAEGTGGDQTSPMRAKVDPTDYDRVILIDKQAVLDRVRHTNERMTVSGKR